MHTILLIEDDDDQADLLRYSLEKTGYITKRASTGTDGIAMARNESTDLVLCDVWLPDLDGFEVCRRILQSIPMPVVLMSACFNSEDDRIRALSIGAQDCLPKSHSHKELLLRISRLLRDKQSSSSELAVCDLRVSGFHVYRNERIVDLTTTEFRLLVCLIRHYPNVASYKELCWEVWHKSEPDCEKLKVHISRLREKISIDNPSGCHIKVKYGLGYALACHGARAV